MQTTPPIYLFTDFGFTDPYVGQMHARLVTEAPGTPVVDLHHYAPAFRPDLAGLLLGALLPYLPAGGVVVGVVDPGVGTERGELAVHRDGRWLVGPDNGLFSPVLGPGGRAYRLALPARSGESVSFHGRDRFAPAAAALARGENGVLGPEVARPVRSEAVAEQVIYRDHYGNLITGLQTESQPDPQARLALAGTTMGHGRTFGDVAPGALFWYANSLGLVEVAAREASAAECLGVGPGQPVAWAGE